MFSALLELLNQSIINYGYYILFVVTLLENSIFLGAFVPGEVTAVLAGFYAGQGVLSLPLVIILNTLGAVIGDNIGFFLGRKKGKRWLGKLGKRFNYSEERIDEAEEYWVEYGGKAVFFARFIAFARTFIPFLSGASKLKWQRFFLYDLFGAVIHGIVMVSIGYFFGENWEKILHTFGVIGFLLLAIFLGTLYRYIVKKGIGRLEEGEKNENN